jgi:hypothetical protein
MKIVVFDLDETLGSFVEFGIFWDCLHRYFSKTSQNHLTQVDFNTILDLYPEFLRPNIMKILYYLKFKKECNHCKKLMIYTNNQGLPSWAYQLKSYFESKIDYPLFDKVIAAFKINGKRIEICRSSHDKTYHDLLKCTKIPLHAEICFIDDNYFPGMYNDNVYYINLKPYTHDIEFDIMISTFLESEISKKIIPTNEKLVFEDFMKKEFQLYHYKCIEKSKEEQKIDEIISKEILVHLENFFDVSKKIMKKKPKTRKAYRNKRNQTHKNILF